MPWNPTFEMPETVKNVRAVADSVLLDNGIEILVFNLNNPQNIVEAMKGNHNGTLVK